jgi:N-acetylmuramoyl-L-alanine amidase
MSLEHVVKQGECLSSIAQEYGLLPKSIWEDGANASLRSKRKDPNVLYPGDVVVIPDKQEKEVPGPTEKRHKFLRKGATAKLRLRFLIDDKPASGESYELHIGTEVIKGKTDGGGWLEAVIPPDATQGYVIFGKKRRSFSLAIGHVDPVAEVSGAKARLRNLGFYSGELDGELDEATENALRAFQRKFAIQETGKLDANTQDQLLKQHGG